MAGLVQYNFTIDNTSPILAYSPYADFASTNGQGSGLLNGWQTWYTGSGYLPSSGGGPSGFGQSYHLTSLPGASVSLSFYGTGIALYGVSNCSYDVTFDGSLVPDATLSQGVFFSKADAEAGFHNVSLTAKPDSDDQILSFKSAIVTSAANTSLSSPIYSIVDNQNTTAITYTGDWTPSKTIANIPSSASPAPFHSTTASGASAFLNFNGKAIAIYGSSTTNHGQYSVTLDGVQKVLNGTSEWLLGNMLMFHQDGLDESSAHSVNITNLSDLALSLNSVQITQFDSAPSGSAGSTKTSMKGSSSKVGAIVGPVIAFVVVASLVGLYIWMKRRAKNERQLGKIERRSSIASSIFLPRRFRRKNNENNDGVTPYVIELGPSQLDTLGSFASLDGEYAIESRRKPDEKGRLVHLPIAVPTNNERAFIQPTERQQPRSVPVSYIPSESEMPHVDSRRSSHTSRLPPNAPNTSSINNNSNVVAPVQSEDPALVERVLELVSRRIDFRRPPMHSGERETVDRLPPYPEDV